MGSVTNLNPAEGVGDFCDFLYGAESGFVYVPSKDPDSGYWDEAFFPWPSGRQSIIDRVTTLSKSREMYIGPAIYNEPINNISYIKGSNVTWAEFDGNIPALDEMEGSPLPTMRVRSSKPGHEHWYWKLNKFSTDIKSVQDTNKALAYALRADLSGWDLGQVLRPVGGLNHKRGGLAVTLVQNTLRSHSLDDFNKLPTPEVSYTEADFDEKGIPDVDKVLLGYAWKSSEIELLKAKAQPGQRSSMLTKLAYTCCEKGLDNSETFAILQGVDVRWGKYAGRTNSKQCYIALIDYARQKYPYTSLLSDKPDAPDPEAEVSLAFPMLGILDHIANVDPLEYIIPGILHKIAALFLVGESESYKTWMACELGINLCLGTDMLEWKISSYGQPLKIGVFSLEMSAPEINERYEDIILRYTTDVQQILNERFLTFAGNMRLHNPADVEQLRQSIIKYQLDGIIIDSAQMSFSDNMSDESFVKKSVSELQKIRHELGVFSIIVHHPRKLPTGSLASAKAVSGLKDLFGSQVLQNSATTVISMAKKTDKTEEGLATIDMAYLKMRSNKEVRPANMTLEFQPDLTFSRAVMGALGPVPDDQFTALDAMAEEVAKPKKKDNGPGLSF